YALHVGIIPALIVIVLIMHIAVFRRHGVTAPKDAKGEDMFWPAQAFRDMVACMLIFGVLLALVLFGGPSNPADHKAFHRGAGPAPEAGMWEDMAFHGRNGGGANLDAPADPSTPYPARPES